MQDWSLGKFNKARHGDGVSVAASPSLQTPSVSLVVQLAISPEFMSDWAV